MKYFLLFYCGNPNQNVWKFINENKTGNCFQIHCKYYFKVVGSENVVLYLFKLNWISTNKNCTYKLRIFI